MAGMVSITITKNLLPSIAAKLPGKTRQVVQKATLDVEAEAKVRAPFRFGALRNSIKGEMTGPDSGEVTVGVEYGAPVEYGSTHKKSGGGTYHIPAQPYLHPAADVVRPGFEAAVAKMIEGLA